MFLIFNLGLVHLGYVCDCILGLLLQFHPDVNKDSRAGELFKSVRCSYEVSIPYKLPFPFYESVVVLVIQCNINRWNLMSLYLYFFSIGTI